MKTCELCKKKTNKLRDLYKEDIGYIGKVCNWCYNMYCDYFVVLTRKK